MRTLFRALAGATLIFGFATAVAAMVTFLMLEDSAWTEPRPSRAPAVSVQPEPTGQAPEPQGEPSRWALGSCLTPELQPVTCRPGVLRVIGTVHQPGPTPCADLPETTHTRHADDTALCLTTRH